MNSGMQRSHDKEISVDIFSVGINEWNFCAGSKGVFAQHRGW
jgi:hypothetical protein